LKLYVTDNSFKTSKLVGKVDFNVKYFELSNKNSIIFLSR
jgi:hypothetical protein